MDKIRFLGAENEISRVPFGSILKETREKTTVENEDTLLSCAINGIFRNDELFSHFRGSSTIGYIKVKKNDLILSAQNLHLGNANVNLRFEHGIISPAYKVYRITGAEPEYIAQWVKRPAANQFFLAATTEGASQCRKNIDWDALYRQPIVLPSSDEQKKIAKLLMSLDFQIAFEKTEVRKLKDFKSAMLTKMFPKEGKTEPEIRFPGFTDAWEQRKLGEIANFSKGVGYSKNDLCEEGTPIILYGRLYTKYETSIFDVDTFVKEKAGSVYSKGGEVIVPASGETAEDISIASVVVKPGILLGGDLNIVSPTTEYDSAFLALTISSGAAHKYLSSLAQGKSVVHLHNADIQSVSAKFPTKREQEKIHLLFGKIDTLITLHQRKYEKLIDTKKAFLEKLIGGEK